MSDVIALLGGRKTLGVAPRAQADFIEILRAGLPYDALRAVATVSVRRPAPPAHA